MAHWTHTITFKDIWGKVDAGTWTIQQLAAEVARRIKVHPMYEINGGEFSEIDEIALRFEDVATDPKAGIEDFDDALAEFYDWADEGTFTRKRCWIEVR